MKFLEAKIEKYKIARDSDIRELVKTKEALEIALKNIDGASMRFRFFRQPCLDALNAGMPTKKEVIEWSTAVQVKHYPERGLQVITRYNSTYVEIKNDCFGLLRYDIESKAERIDWQKFKAAIETAINLAAENIEASKCKIERVDSDFQRVRKTVEYLNSLETGEEKGSIFAYAYWYAAQKLESMIGQTLND